VRNTTGFCARTHAINKQDEEQIVKTWRWTTGHQHVKHNHNLWCTNVLAKHGLPPSRHAKNCWQRLPTSYRHPSSIAACRPKMWGRVNSDLPKTQTWQLTEITLTNKQTFIWEKRCN